MSSEVKYIGMDVHKEAIVIAVRDTSRLRKKGLRDLDSSSLRDFVIGEGFCLHPLVSRGFIFGPASTLRTWLTSLESPDSSCGLSYRQPRQR